jgi:hypothetical protein
MSNEITVQNNPQVVSTETQAVLSMIERVVLNPDADMDKLEKMLDMQERILKRNGEQAFAADFAAMQSELPRIARNGQIDIKKDGRLIQSTKFAKLEDINDGVRPVLQKYGFGVSFSIDQNQSGITVTAKLLHRLGHSEKTSLSLPVDTSGSKNNVQGNGSTISYGKRYTLCAILNISTGDDVDGNLQDDSPVTSVLSDEDLNRLRGALKVANYEEAAFCKSAGIQSLEQLAISRYAGAMAHIQGKANASN